MKRALAVMFLMFAPLQASEYPWSSTVPAELAAAAIAPDTVVDEIPCDWRPTLTPLISPLVQDCTTAREAVLAVSTGLGKATGAYYSRERSKHNMNVLETLREKKISCTGQSILLVCALRSVGIPARAVGVHTWNHIEGNHTWAEAWFDGEWHMIEMGERDFNTPWVMEYIGMLNPRHPFQRILAASPSGQTTWWPKYVAKTGNLTNFAADDVTQRYMQLARRWYATAGIPENTQRILIDLQPRPEIAQVVEIVNENGEVISSGELPTSRHDMRYMTRLNMPRSGNHYLRLAGSAERTPIRQTAAPVQILRVKL